MKSLDEFDWKALEMELDVQGAAILREVFSASEIDDLLTALDQKGSLNSSVPLASAHAGSGAVSELADPLPAILQELGTSLYARLLPIADRWNEVMGAAVSKRGTRSGGLARAEKTSLVREDLVLLHQGSQATGGFALDAMLLMSQPGQDFDGGELAMTEQRPRMQSRPMVVPLKLGDIAIFSGGQRPFKGSKGFYKVTLKSAVSRVRDGERVALNLFFREAP